MGFLATFICFSVTVLFYRCLYFVVNQIKLQSKVTKLIIWDKWSWKDGIPRGICNVFDKPLGSFWATQPEVYMASSLFICFYATKIVLLSFFTLNETTYLKIWAKPRPRMQKAHFRLTCKVKRVLTTGGRKTIVAGIGG